jgi:hypothetical protein
MARIVIHYWEAGCTWAYCNGSVDAIASRKMRDVTCKRCLAKLQRDEVIKHEK